MNITSALGDKTSKESLTHWPSMYVAANIIKIMFLCFRFLSQPGAGPVWCMKLPSSLGLGKKSEQYKHVKSITLQMQMAWDHAMAVVDQAADGTA